jgi:signal transduction histidine kinase
MRGDMTAMHLARVAELERANCELQTEVVRCEAAVEAARLSRTELALLSQKLIQAQEMERWRIARELHDSAGQSLIAIKYSLERAAELQRQNKHADAAPLLSRTIGLVRDTITEVRAIAMDLRPSLLDDLGVASALGWLCREFAETHAQIEFSTEIAAGDAEIPDPLATTIFRCAQELLNNAARHSRARSVSIGLIRGSNSVTLTVRDDGVGMPQPNASGSFGQGHGIRNLRERAQMTGGSMIIGGNRSTGTCVQVDWPLATKTCLLDGAHPVNFAE